jgi:hypothetical protein
MAAADPNVCYLQTVQDIKTSTILKIRLLVEEFIADGGFQTYRAWIETEDDTDRSPCFRLSWDLHTNAMEFARHLRNLRYDVEWVGDSDSTAYGNYCFHSMCPFHCGLPRKMLLPFCTFAKEILQILYAELQTQSNPNAESLMEIATVRMNFVW